MKELKRCPFCGSKPEMEIGCNDWGNMLIIAIKCPACGIPKPHVSIPLGARISYDKFMEKVDKITDQWNTRCE